MWAARARTWRQGSPHGSRLGYLPLLISYGLLWLNPREWGDAATIPTTTKRSYHHLAILKHQYHNNEYNVDNNNYNNNFKKCSFWYTYTRKIYFFFSLQQKWHSPTLRSGIHQHLSTNSPRFYSSSNPSQPNHSSLLRTTRCGISLEPWFIRTWFYKKFTISEELMDLPSALREVELGTSVVESCHTNL